MKFAVMKFALSKNSLYLEFEKLEGKTVHVKLKLQIFVI